MYEDVLLEARLPQDKLTPRESFWGAILVGLYVVHIYMFMIPGFVWKNFHAEIFCSEIYPEIVFKTIEHNLIKPSDFSISAYVFWSISPLISIYSFCFFLAIMWPLRRVEIYIARRKLTKTKNFNLCLVVFLFLPIVLIFFDQPHGARNPLKSKLGYYVIYQGLILAFSMSIVCIIANIRARIYLNIKKENSPYKST